MDFVLAFLIGGAICVCGQLLIDLTKLTPGRIMVIFVITGVVLSAIGVYDKFADFAGAGATVPLIGFGHLLASGAEKAVAEDGILGAFGGGLADTATVLSAVVLLGLLASVTFKRRDRI